MKKGKFALILTLALVLVGCGTAKESSKQTVEKTAGMKQPKPEKLETMKYTDVDGVLTFRGNERRTAPAYGTVNITEKSFEPVWSFATGDRGGPWGGGAGWTGQPALVKWPKETKQIMNLDQKYIEDDNFVEVIQASLNGKIYFFDLATGALTREPIDLKDPIKGSVSVDSRGWPLLYVGQGIKESDEVCFYLISLIDQRILFSLNADDPDAPRVHPAFDSSALFDRKKDRLIVGGENGLVYRLDLQTKFNPKEKTLEINPKIKKYGYQKNGDDPEVYGIENSLSRYGDNVYFADNDGLVTCLDLKTMKAVWTYQNLDDTDASTVIGEEDGISYVYTVCEIDRQGAEGTCRIVKLNGETGAEVWRRDYHAFNKDGVSPSNGGGLATPVLGKGDMKGLIVFNLCRTPNFASGYTVALSTETGEEVWSKVTDTYSWSSPVDVYNKAGKGYLIQVDRNGYLRMMDGRTGAELASIKAASYTEASPAVYNDLLVFASRTGKIYCYRIK